MGTRPSSDPTWATNATPNVNEPAGQRADGYPNGFVPPAGAHNWQFQTIGEWLDYLDKTAGKYASLGAAAAALSPGETGLVQTIDDWSGSPAIPLAVDASEATTTARWAHSDGEYVLLARDADMQLREYDDLSTVVRTYTPSNAGVPLKCVSNGEYVAIIYSTYLEVWERDTGTLRITFDHQGSIYDVAMNGRHVAIVGERNGTNTSSFEVHELQSPWNNVGSYDHGASLWSLTVYRNKFFALGADGGTGANKQLLRLTSTGTVQWEVDPPTVVVAGTLIGNCIACNRKFVAYHNGGAAAAGYSHAGELIWDSTGLVSWDDTTPNSMWMDHRFLYYLDDSDGLSVVDPANGFGVDGATVADGRSIMSDGDRLWVVDDNADNVQARYTGYAPSIWSRAAAGAARLPIPQVMLHQDV